VLIVGTAVGWTTPTLKKLKKAKLITPDQSSWIAGAHEIGHIVSPIPAGFFLQKYGRKSCLIVSDMFALIGWILVLATKSIEVLYFVRFLFGLSMGIVFTVVPLYIAEVSNSNTRGALSTVFSAMLYFGHVIEFSVGPYVSYETLAWVSLAIAIVCSLPILFLPESPQYLVKNSREKAKKVVGWLLRSEESELLDTEIKKFEDMLTEKSMNKGKLRDLLSSLYRRKLFIVLAVAVAQRFTGMSAVVAYAASTFPSTKGGLNADQYTILFGVISFLFTFVSTAFLDNLGRRPLMLTSCIGCTIFHLITAIYFNLLPSDLTWLPFVTISIFSILYSLGIGPLINTLQGELFPPNLKGLASSFVTITHGVSSFAVTKIFQIIRDDYGIYWNFYLFTLFCLISSVFAYFMVPETKLKSLQELQKPKTTLDLSSQI
jgi:SP family facilitated glucose transporter-like MFS transporter 8